MSNTRDDRDSVHIQAGGDVIGTNVKGDKNIIGKNISTTNTNIQQIAIDEQILKKLYGEYSRAFTQVENSLNEILKESKDIQPQEITEIQTSLEDLAKESEDLTPDKKPAELKKQRWKEKFKIFAKHTIKALPKTAATLALFTPITAPFSETIEEGLQHVVEGMQEVLK
ncbi:MAG TPA: hypothetical protein VLA74_12775 [Nitrososphaeraceae archaeon]|nr:hypothetical protein [Nitrososphaeraceae archaeon]